MLTSSTVYNRLACVRGYAQSLFVLLRHVYLERPKSTPFGRGGLGTLFVPPFRGVQVHSSSSRSPLGDGSISPLENYVPDVQDICLMFASLGSTVPHCSFRTDSNRSQFALWYWYLGVRSISARPGSALPSTMCSGKWSDCNDRFLLTSQPRRRGRMSPS